MRFSRNVRRFSQPLSILTCTDKLRQNDPGFVELSLERVGDDFDVEDFVHGIRCNSSVRHVCFSGTFVRQLQVAQWREMLEAVGHLQSLEELQIWCSSIPIDVFAHTLRNAPRLHKIYLFRVTLVGNQADFNELARSVRHHPCLHDFRIGGFLLEDQSIELDCLVEALADCSTLSVVSLQLSGVRDAAPFSGAALMRLLCSPNISDLYLSRLGLQQEHFAAVAVGLIASHNLRVLDMFGNDVENDHVIMILNALQKNASLETLVLPCPADDLSTESFAAMSLALKRNKTLVTLNLPRSSLDDDGIICLVEGLTVNTTLKKIEVGVRKDISSIGREALTNMLEANYELERLILSSAEKNIKEKVDYYMRLNEVGRGTLLRDGKATREEWVEMLISVKDDLDCLFYFTCHNPSLCQFANVQRADVIVTEEFRPNRRHTINHFSVNFLAEHPIQAKPRRASAF